MTSATFMFETDGTSDYEITLEWTAGSFTLINGFELSVVPPQWYGVSVSGSASRGGEVISDH